MDVFLYVNSPICKEYILNFNIYSRPIILNDEVAEILLKIVQNIYFSIWDFSDIQKSMDNISKFLPNDMGKYINSCLTRHVVSLSILYDDLQVNYKCINQQCLYAAYTIFMAYVFKIIEDYSLKNDLTNINRDILDNIFLQELENNELIILNVDHSSIKIIIQDQLVYLKEKEASMVIVN